MQQTRGVHIQIPRALRPNWPPENSEPSLHRIFLFFGKRQRVCTQFSFAVLPIFLNRMVMVVGAMLHIEGILRCCANVAFVLA
jgi:hypothetical protein